MASYTKIRTTAISGSIPGDGEAAAAASTLVIANLDKTLDHMASAIKRIHGDASFTENAAGVFSQAIKPDSSGGQDLGSTSAEWGDLFMGDGKAVKLGADQDVTLTHVADTGVILNGAMQLQFGDAATHVKQVSDSNLEVEADGSIILDSPVVDFQDDGVIAKFGDDSDVTLTHVADTGLRLNAAMKLQFRDATEFVHSDANGYMHMEGATGVHLAVNGTDELAVTATESTFGGNIAIPNDGTIGSAGDSDAVAISAAGVVALSSTTAASSRTTGALTVAGGISTQADLYVGDDLMLDSDAAVLGFGDDGDVTLTHVADTGLLLNGAMQLQFNDASQYINAPSATVLDINATDEIELNATDIDINGAVDISGNLTIGGNLDVNGTVTTVDTTNMTIEDRIIGLGVSGSNGNYSALNTGIVFGYGNKGAVQAGISYDGAVFQLAKSTTSPASASFAMPAAADYSTLLVGKVEPGAAGVYDLGSTASEWGDLFMSDGKAIKLGADQDVTLTHVADTGVILNSSRQLQFGDAATHIKQVSDSNLEVEADGSIILDSPIIDLQDDSVSLRFGDDSDVSLNHVPDAGLLLNSTRYLSFSDANSYISNPGAGLKLTDHAVIEVEAATSIQMDSPIVDFEDDAVILQFGADDDVTLSHVADTGLILNAAMQLQFGDNGTYIHQVSNGILKLVSDNILELNADEVIVGGATPRITIGDADGEDTLLVFDGNAQDYRIGLDDGTDKLEFGLGAAHGSTIAFTIDSSQVTDFPQAGKLSYGGVAITATGTELNIMDGGTSATSTTLADADRCVVNDAGTMKQVALSDFLTYFAPSKYVATRTAVLAANTDLATGLTGIKTADEKLVEVYVNGQLMSRGANAAANKDWYPGANADEICFEFALEIDDVVTAILRKV